MNKDNEQREISRELKFRVWNPVYGMAEPATLRQMTTFEQPGNGIRVSEQRYPDDSVFMQFTGLLDTLDDPIYEGDRLFHKGKEWEVEFNQDYAGYCLVRNLVRHGENESIRFDCDVACRSEVIGNIYESEPIVK